jgi:hypothetical protein
MADFLLLFRNEPNGDETPSPEQLQDMFNNWRNWMGGIAAQNKLVNPGSRLSHANARVIKPGALVTDGPYTEIKEFISGFIVVSTGSIEEAVDIAKGCPIFNTGGSVEVRTVVPMENNK